MRTYYLQLNIYLNNFGWFQNSYMQYVLHLKFIILVFLKFGTVLTFRIFLCIQKCVIYFSEGFGRFLFLFTFIYYTKYFSYTLLYCI